MGIQPLVYRKWQDNTTTSKRNRGLVSAALIDFAYYDVTAEKGTKRLNQADSELFDYKDTDSELFDYKDTS